MDKQCKDEIVSATQTANYEICKLENERMKYSDSITMRIVSITRTRDTILQSINTNYRNRASAKKGNTIKFLMLVLASCLIAIWLL